MLESDHLHGTIVYLILVVFDLSTGVYGAVATVISILSKKDDDRSALRFDKCGGVDEFEGIELVIVNTGHVDFAGVFEGYSGVTA